ncbi:hypothetical protein BT69DRAFT_1340889 [Atractiella rhizophila]|nr:hypothetical protein BT69DRAFT_1340889 [Atractiella rhizophila]
MNCTWPFEGEEDEDMRAKEDKIRTLEQRVQSLQEILHSNEELIRSYQDAQQHQTNLNGTPQRPLDSKREMEMEREREATPTLEDFQSSLSHLWSLDTGKKKESEEGKS